MNRFLNRCAAVSLAALASVAATPKTLADPIFWVEPGNDDLSGGGDLRVFNLDLGVNTLMGTIIYGGFPFVADFDSFAFIVPPDTQVTAASVRYYTAQNRYYQVAWMLNTGLIFGNGQLLQDLFCQFPDGQNVEGVTPITTPIGPGAFNLSNYNVFAEYNSVAVWRFDFTVSPLNATGACCTGNACAVTAAAECSSGYQGHFTTCGPVTCCQAPISTPPVLPPVTLDCDGDLVQDTCTLQTDCNTNAAADACETLVFVDDAFSGDGSTDFSWNGSASLLLPSGHLRLTDFAPAQAGTLLRPPVTSGPTQRLRAIFDFRIESYGQSAADGFSFSLMDAGVYGTDVIFGEDGINAPDVLTVKFNTYDNGGEGSNSMFIRYGGVDIAHNQSLPFTLADSAWRRCVIDLTPDGRITVKVGANAGDMAAIFSNVQIPGYVPRRSIIGFGARTGGLYSEHLIDNVRIGVNGPNDLNGNGVPDSCECLADFNNSGAISVQDIFDFLAAYFANCTAAGAPPCYASADFNNSGAISVQDIFDFLAAYFAGCV